MYTDFSQVGLDCVFMQQDRVIAYASSELKAHERNYPTYDMKLAAIMFALRTWHHSMYGTSFSLMTNHKSLNCIFTLKDLKVKV